MKIGVFKRTIRQTFGAAKKMHHIQSSYFDTKKSENVFRET